MKEIVDEVLSELGADRAFARCGSSPSGARRRARPGPRCWCGLTARSPAPSSRLLEAATMGKAAEVIAAGRSELTGMRLRGADLDSPDEMVCGGDAEVLVAYIAAGDRALAEVCAALREAAVAKRRAWPFALLQSGRGRGRVLPAGRRRCAGRGPDLRAGCPAQGRRQDPCTARRSCPMAARCSSRRSTRRPPRSSAGPVTSATRWRRSPPAPAGASSCSTTARSSQTRPGFPAPRSSCCAPSTTRSRGSRSTSIPTSSS